VADAKPDARPLRDRQVGHEGAKKNSALDTAGLLMEASLGHHRFLREHPGTEHLNGELVAASTKLCRRGPLARRERLGGLLNHY